MKRKSIDPFYECMNYTDSDILPKQGDFSFIKNETIKQILEYDYNYLLLNNDFWILTSYISKKKMLETRSNFHPFHNDRSFLNSLRILRFIKLEGWTEFVIKMLNLMYFEPFNGFQPFKGITTF